MTLMRSRSAATTDDSGRWWGYRLALGYLNVDARMTPVLLLSFLSSFALSLRVDFVGIWALSHLGVAAAALGIAYVVNAALEAPSSVAAGWLLTVRSKRTVYVWSAVANACIPALFVMLGGHPIAALVVMTIGGATDSFGWVAMSVAIADDAEDDDLEAAYSAQRVVGAAGLAIGPLLAGLLLLVSWDALWVGASASCLLAAAVAVRILPAGHAAPPQRDAGDGPRWGFLRSPVFIGLFVAGVISYVILFVYEIVFPIVLTADGTVSAAHIAFIIGINPALVIFLQTGLTRAVSSWSPRLTLVLGPIAMALPALLFLIDRSPWTIVLVLALGAIGEMLWNPASSAVAARMAPPGLRGPYIGTLATTYSFGIALAPLAGLTARGELGSTALFSGIALAGLAAALLYAVAIGPRRDSTLSEVMQQ